MTSACERCGKTLGGQQRKYCSRSCANAAISQSLRTGNQLQCLQCGASFYMRASRGAKLCSIHCRAALTKKRTLDGFWSRIAVAGDSECWPFQGGTNRDGYGLAHLMGKKVLAHRAAKALADGPPCEESLVACHACDNPRCCNPAHIFWGTAADNNQDAKKKRRHAHGARCGAAKLTEEAARVALSSPLSVAAIASQFGVSQACIRLLRSRKTWAHIGRSS